MNIIIFEDEPLIAYSIKNTLLKYGVSECAVFTETNSAFSTLKFNTYDAAFVDVQINGKPDGLLFAEKCKELNIPVVFLTSYSDDKTIKSLVECDPIAYMNKPFKEAELNAIVKLISKRNSNNIVLLKDGKKEYKINLADILYFESDTPYAIIHLTSGKISVRKSLTKLMDLFSPTIKLVRINKFMVVAENKISVRGIKQVTINNIQLPVSKKYSLE